MNEPNSATNYTTRQIVIWLVVFKAAYAALVFCAAVLIPPIYSVHNCLRNSPGLVNPPNTFAAHFMTWDSVHYLYLSANAYRPGLVSDAFYPLWPFCIRVFSEMSFGNRLVAALLLANLFSLFATVLIFIIAKDTPWVTHPGQALIMALAYPGAIFLVFPYSEPLFLLLAAATLLAIRRDQLGIAAITMLLSALTRPTGLFWAPAILLYFALQKRYSAMWLALSPVVGFCIYLLIMFVQTGNAFAEEAAISTIASGASPENFVNALSFLMAFLRIDNQMSLLGSPADRIAFLWCVVCLPFLYRKDKLLFSYTAAMSVLAAVGNHFEAFTRYAAIAFPVFFVTAEHFAPIQRQFGFVLLAAFLFAMQIIFLLRHMNFYWVG